MKYYGQDQEKFRKFKEKINKAMQAAADGDDNTVVFVADGEKAVCLGTPIPVDERIVLCMLEVNIEGQRYELNYTPDGMSNSSDISYMPKEERVTMVLKGDAEETTMYLLGARAGIKISHDDILGESVFIRWYCEYPSFIAHVIIHTIEDIESCINAAMTQRKPGNSTRSFDYLKACNHMMNWNSNRDHHYVELDKTKVDQNDKPVDYTISERDYE